DAGIARDVVLARKIADRLGAGVDDQPIALALGGARPKILLELADPFGRLLGDHRDAANTERAVGMPGPLAAIDELRRQMLADEEADNRHVGLGDSHGAEPGVLRPACDLD